MERYLPFLGYGDEATAIPLGVLLVISVLLDFALVEWSLFRSKEPATLARILIATLGMGLLLVLKVALFRQLGLNYFGVLLVAAYTLALVVPVVGVRLLLQVRGRSDRNAVRWVATGAVLCAPVYLYAHYIEPQRLSIDHVRAEEIAGVKQPLRIGVLSDLQCESIGAHERDAVRVLMEQQPDLILLPGDLLQGSEELFERWLPELNALLGELHAPGGVFLVVGDVDTEERCERATRDTDVVLLVNEVVELDVSGQRVRMLGMSSPIGRAQIGRAGHPGGYTGGPRVALDAFAAEADTHCLRILLAHRPGMLRFLGAEHHIDLMVAGHTHGGQVVVPFYGPPITFSPMPREVAAGGLHRIRDLQLYVSRGVGLERSQAPRIRFLCPPEVGVIELEPATPSAPR